MIHKFLKLIAAISIVLLSITSLSIADNHISKKEMISELRKEINELGEKPIKRKFLQGDTKFITALKDQKEEIEKEKAKRAKIDAVKEEIVKELDKLGEKPIADTKDIDTDEEIIALRKQLDDLKKKTKDKKEKEKKEAKDKAEAKKIADEKEKILSEIKEAKEQLINELKKLGKEPVVTLSEVDSNEDIIALRKQLKQIKDEIEKKRTAEQDAEETKQARSESIQTVKKEILFLGETPISEFEATNNDEYIAALNKQLENIKQIKADEEKEIQQSIPSWFIKVPGNTEKEMFVRGTHVSDTLQGSVDVATNRALRELIRRIEARISYKQDEMVREAGISEDTVTKTTINTIAKTVSKEITVSGWEVVDSKIVSMDNGMYRTFIYLKYPLGMIYKSFINKIEENENLKKNVTALKNTEAFKELEQYVAEFSSGA